MTPEEQSVIRAAMRYVRHSGAEYSSLHAAVQALKVSRQPEHTVEPIPCMKYAPNSATMFCVLPLGHEDGEPDKYGLSYHVGLAGQRAGLPPSRRSFRYSADRDTMEGHERPACPRFPGCERHP